MIEMWAKCNFSLKLYVQYAEYFEELSKGYPSLFDQANHTIQNLRVQCDLN